MANIIKVLVIGDVSDAKLATILTDPNISSTTGFEFKRVPDDSKLFADVATFSPHLILTTENPEKFPVLFRAPIDIRGRWLSAHFSHAGPVISDQIMRGFIALCDGPGRFAHKPLITVFTGSYKTGEPRLRRAFESLRRQTYPNWEWVVLDDSDDAGETFAALQKICEEDCRVRAYKAHKNFGVIGKVKREAARLGRGSILVELDHDDALTPTCLNVLRNALAEYPDAGFAYGNCCEMSERGVNRKYEAGWGFGYGAYETVRLGGVDYEVALTPEINGRTIRYITGIPNHVRAWRASFYDSIGGHNPEIHVADDYELVVKTFLKTRIVHAHHFSYVQYFNGKNTQITRNGEVKRLTRYFSHHYERKIHERLLELGVADDVWTDKGRPDYSRPKLPGHANYIYVPGK